MAELEPELRNQRMCSDATNGQRAHIAGNKECQHSGAVLKQRNERRADNA